MICDAMNYWNITHQVWLEIIFSRHITYLYSLLINSLWIDHVGIVLKMCFVFLLNYAYILNVMWFNIRHSFHKVNFLCVSIRYKNLFIRLIGRRKSWTHVEWAESCVRASTCVVFFIQHAIERLQCKQSNPDTVIKQLIIIVRVKSYND